MPSESSIYTGPWINHSRNIWLGATITLNDRDSAFLIALLTLVVTTAGQSFWRIVCFVTHQIRTASHPHDAIFHQQQAILKNQESPLSAAWKLSRTSFTWRRHERTRWWQFWRSRSLFLVLLAIILAGAFAVASIFSSQVTKAAGTEVLINSPDCGDWEFNASDPLSQASWGVKKLNESIAAASYASTCYGSGSNAECNTYVAPEISWKTNQNASCPFGNSTCLFGRTAAYEMDTGLLDSHEILGLDASHSDRVSVRKVATCAPVGLKQYMEIKNVTVDGFYGPMLDVYLQYFLGPIIDTGANWTYQYNTHASLVDFGYDFE